MIVLHRLSLLASVALLVTACASAHVDPEAVAPRDYAAALDQASLEVRFGRYGVADRVLSEFAAKAPASPEAIETLYWRALFKADPANQVALVREAIPMLDAYLAAPAASTAHRTEAAALKRLVTLVDSRVAVAPVLASAPVATKPDAAKDEEIARLKEELQRANAELERIKRRLAQPRS